MSTQFGGTTRIISDECNYSAVTGGVKHVGVVGLGVMGFDIAFVYAMRGYPTTAYDASTAVMESFNDRREKTIERLKRRGRISDGEVGNVRQGLRTCSDLRSMAGLDLVTEAVSEAAEIKVSVYRTLSESGFNGILTTNTSSLPRHALLASGSYPRARFATTHFFNPVLYTQMVEVVKGDMEEPNFSTAVAFLKHVGRDVVSTKDISGFVSNSILMYYAVMALHLVQCGAPIDQIDRTAKQMGLLPPFISFDSWKPSIVEDVTRVMFEMRGDKFLRSSKLLADLAQNNPSFYVERKPNPEISRQIGAHGQPPDEVTIQKALRTTIHVAAARTVELGEDPSTVDLISVEGIKIPEAPLNEIDKIGAEAVLENVKNVNEIMADHALPTPPLLTAMAKERQTFYRKGQTNPWVISFVERQRSHAGD